MAGDNMDEVYEFEYDTLISEAERLKEGARRRNKAFVSFVISKIRRLEDRVEELEKQNKNG